MTTKFTELTTVFENDTFNPETFGITNIDIDFNSSHTPMVKIDFVDVRGSSIFQNEELLLNNETENKYATFFEFPYPLFELEIKGYYGQPVTYCLHMLKFNSKFNSFNIVSISSLINVISIPLSRFYIHLLMKIQHFLRSILFLVQHYLPLRH